VALMASENAQQLAAASGVPLDHVERVLEALMDSGYVAVTRGELVDVRGMADMLAEHLDRILQGTYPVKDE
jgi:hypothetical protein